MLEIVQERLNISDKSDEKWTGCGKKVPWDKLRGLSPRFGLVVLCEDHHKVVNDVEISHGRPRISDLHYMSSLEEVKSRRRYSFLPASKFWTL